MTNDDSCCMEHGVRKIEGLPGDWLFLECPGHFIGAARCTFSRHTHVGNLRYCVSTIGEYRPDGGEAVEIGTGRLYETMVFDLDLGEDRWSDSDIELAYNDKHHAHDGHLEVCFAWDRKAKEGDLT